MSYLGFIFNKMNNLDLYNYLRVVPEEAKKTIKGGRIAGMTDINPMWRIKMMTEAFGICGIGWKYEITRQWSETFGEEVKAYCNINLYVKVKDEWSEAIPGTGGSTEVSKERSGVYVSDECYKMALTDALSVAMKALGVGADVYFSNDRTKYTQPTPAQPEQPTQKIQVSEMQFALAELNASKTKEDLQQIARKYKHLLSNTEFVSACTERRKMLGV